MNDSISRQAAIQTAERMYKRCDTGSIEDYHDLMVEALTALPPAQQTTLTADDIETIRIHLSAFKETLCNQGRWTEAAEYERLIQRLTGKGGQE